MKPLIVLPNFQIVALQGTELNKTIKLFADSTLITSQSETFSLTAHSFWRGLNKTNSSSDFISILIDNAEQIPANVLAELENWEVKFGDITLLNDNCLQIASENLKEEILKHNILKNYTNDYLDKLIFFKNIALKDLIDIFEKEINYPIKLQRSTESVKENKIDYNDFEENHLEEDNRTVQQRQVRLHDETSDLFFKKMMKLLERI